MSPGPAPRACAIMVEAIAEHVAPFEPMTATEHAWIAHVRLKVECAYPPPGAFYHGVRKDAFAIDDKNIKRGRKLDWSGWNRLSLSVRPNPVGPKELDFSDPQPAKEYAPILPQVAAKVDVQPLQAKRSADMRAWTTKNAIPVTFGATHRGEYDRHTLGLIDQLSLWLADAAAEARATAARTPYRDPYFAAFLPELAMHRLQIGKARRRLRDYLVEGWRRLQRLRADYGDVRVAA